jgi:Dyp-type peroxidase family
LLRPFGFVRPAFTDLEDLKIIPGNTAKAHGRPFSTWLFFRFAPEASDPAAQLRSFIASCRAAGFHTSMQEQLDQWVAYNARKKALGGPVPDDDPVAIQPFGQVLLTRLSFEILGAGPADYQQFLVSDSAFKVGMPADRVQLGDPPAGTANDHWYPQFAQEFHVALFLAGNTRDGCDAHVKAALELAYLCKLVEAHREDGFVWQPDGPDTPMREPFGFADGLSNLLFLDDDVQAERAAGPLSWDPVAKWDNVLYLPPPGSKPRTLDLAGGSFVVLRKLEQDVVAFRTWESGPARSAASLVGRDRAGRPLTGLPPGGRPNDFNYARDPAAAVCPFHAHIRKANPRGTSSPAHDEAQRLFVRRGMVYAPGSQLDPAAPPPTFGGKVGLLFTGYMGGIVRQFQFMQANWLCNPGFPAPGLSGPDPLLASTPLNPGARPFVTPRGGGYFFAPPVSWIEKLRP